MTDFVCGFLISFDMENFPLIRKRDTHPDPTIRDRWNGPGGKLEPLYHQMRDDLNDNVITVEMGKLSEYVGKEYSVIGSIFENPHQAMEREFLEETGVKVIASRWHCFYIEEFAHNGNRVYYMAAIGDDYKNAKTMTDEEIKIFSYEDFIFMDSKQLVYNLHYIIPMLKCQIKSGFFKMIDPQGVNRAFRKNTKGS